MTPASSPTRNARSIFVLAVACLALATTVLLMLRPIRVVGSSMEPTLRDGDIVLVWSGPGWRNALEVGSIVVADAPDSQRIGVRPVIKRVEGRDETTATPRWRLVGDNRSTSRDSREYGTIAESQLEGIVVWRIYPRPGGI